MSEHVKRIVEESVRFILMLSLIASSYLIIMGAGALYQDHQRAMHQKVQTVPEISKKELREAHTHHGITFSEQDASGEWFFMRDNKRCKLFGYRKVKK